MLEVRECWGEGVLEEVCLISISITDHNSPSYCLFIDYKLLICLMSPPPVQGVPGLL